MKQAFARHVNAPARARVRVPGPTRLARRGGMWLGAAAAALAVAGADQAAEGGAGMYVPGFIALQASDCVNAASSSGS